MRKASTVLLNTKLEEVPSTMQYYDNGKVCAIGCLLVDAGVPMTNRSALGEVDTEFTTKIGIENRTPAEWVETIYGLPYDIVHEIMKQFHITHSLKKVGQWLKSKGY